MADDPDAGAPLSTWTALRGGTRLAGRAVATGARRLLARNEWCGACSIDADGPLPDLERMTPLIPPRDRCWADPFPVVDGDRACIFVEEWPYALGRGVLAALEIEVMISSKAAWPASFARRARLMAGATSAGLSTRSA